MNDLVIVEKDSHKSVIAARDFLKGERILLITGPLMHRSELPPDERIVLPEEDRYLQIDKDYYLGPSFGIDDMVNHSCEPNSAVYVLTQHVELRALRDIEKGEEITYDYSPLMYNDTWTMQCTCDVPSCRGIVKQYEDLPKELKKKYKEWGIVPDYNQ